MLFDAVIFDFDGTLVDSAIAKRQAFFAIFPDTAPHRAMVSGVLTEDPDGSRHRVIPLMVERLKAAGLDPQGGLSADALIRRYGIVAEDAVKQAPELPGATGLLAALSPLMRLHVCSNTPEDSVRAHVAARGWQAHFSSVDGHPTEKISKVAQVIAAGGYLSERVAVIGDGVSDAEAARANGCRFIAIEHSGDLAKAGRILGVPDV